MLTGKVRKCIRRLVSNFEPQICREVLIAQPVLPAASPALHESSGLSFFGWLNQVIKIMLFLWNQEREREREIEIVLLCICGCCITIKFTAEKGALKHG